MTFRTKRFSEERKRLAIASQEFSRNVLKAGLYNQRLSRTARDKISLILSSRKKALAIRAKNRCLYTNRAKSVIRFFGMSRIVFRLYARSGALQGVRRASW
jgi:small subunit ribosomal protein S14